MKHLLELLKNIPAKDHRKSFYFMFIQTDFTFFQAPGLRWLRHGDPADAGAATAGAAGPGVRAQPRPEGGAAQTTGGLASHRSSGQ